MNKEDASKLVALTSLLHDARSNEARAKANLERARAILLNCRGKDHEQLAIQRAAKWWDPYHE